jgi:hypothetical protein
MRWEIKEEEMSTKRTLPRFVIGLLSVALVLAVIAGGATPALAQGNPPLWYKFQVGSVDPDTETSFVSVVLRDQANCQGGFQVYTAENWNYWGMSTIGDPLGRATDIGDDMHMWAGRLVPGAYYVRLGWNIRRAQQPAAQSEPVAQVQNPAPSEPAPMIASNPAPASNPIVAAPVPAPVIAAAPRAERPLAEAKPNVWMPVPNNEPTMFEFYVGNVPDDDTSSVGVVLYSGPFRTGRFEIFTAEGKPFYRPQHDDWFGTAESEDGQYASWNGDLVPGVYYVLVYPEGMRNCMLSVSGQSVTF